MEAVGSDDFLKWAAGAGIGFDERYPDARCLGFVRPRDHSRFWTLPGDPHAWPHFAASILKGLDRWSWGFLWPRRGRWPTGDSSSSYEERVRDVVLRAAGIPDGWAGAIRFADRDGDALIAVLFIHLAIGWCVEDDLYFIPDHGRQIVQTSHHDVVHVACADEDGVTEFVTHMAAAGYDLPTEPPDETFRWPAWMGEPPDS
jgi:hypothetical protein